MTDDDSDLRIGDEHVIPLHDSVKHEWCGCICGPEFSYTDDGNRRWHHHRLSPRVESTTRP